MQSPDSQQQQRSPSRDALYGSTSTTTSTTKPLDLKAEVSASVAPAASGGARVAVPTTPLSTSAKPLGQFCYLEKSYSIKTPSCLVPRINELFKSICDRYDVAVVNREKVDEALTLFKQVVGVDKHTSMETSFAAWKDCLTEPRFTVSHRPETGDVKDIRVKAGEIPRERRKAQKHIRDLLDACHLYLQQKEFLQKQIRADLVQLESLSGQIQTLGKQSKLTGAERKQLPKTYSMAREQFAQFSEILDFFFVHVYSLINEINTAVHVLEAREGSAERL